MSRKKTTPLEPTEDYWVKFLQLQNLLVTHELETTQQPKQASSAPTSPLHPDMLTFVYRVAERLTPLDGLDATGRSRALKVREEFRRELTEVFQGREDYNAWFDRTRTQLGLHLIQFVRILYECLEGLRSEGARSLRREYEVTLGRLRA